MRLDPFVIAILVFSTFIIGGTLIIGDFNDHYEEFGANLSDENFDERYSKLSNLTGFSDDVKSEVLEGSSGELAESETEETSMIIGAYKGIKLVWGILGIPGDIVGDLLQEDFGINPIFGDLATIAFSIIILFSIIYLVMRYRN